MKEIFRQLIESTLVWHEQPGARYTTTFQGKEATLQFTDFPVHPWPFIMIVGAEQQNWEEDGDIPKNWTLINNDELKVGENTR